MNELEPPFRDASELACAQRAHLEPLLPLSKWVFNFTPLTWCLRRGGRITLKCAKSYDHLNLETDTSSGTKQALN